MFANVSLNATELIDFVLFEKVYGMRNFNDHFKSFVFPAKVFQYNIVIPHQIKLISKILNQSLDEAFKSDFFLLFRT